MSIYEPQLIVQVSRTGVDVPGMWPGWDTAIAIIIHIHPKTRREQMPHAGDSSKEVADRIGERIRVMREEGGRAVAEEYYEVLDRFGLLPVGLQTEMGLPAFTDVTSGEELAFQLQSEALVSWARGPGALKCGPYQVEKSFLDAPRLRELMKLEKEAKKRALSAQQKPFPK